MKILLKISLFLFFFFFFFFYILHSVLQVTLIGRTVLFFMLGSDLTITDLYISSVGVLLCSALKSLIFTSYDMGTSHMGMQIRVSICSAIYRKVVCYFFYFSIRSFICVGFFGSIFSSSFFK